MMWMFYSKIYFVHIVFLSSTISAIVNDHQMSNPVPYSVKKRLQQLTNDNVLWNNEPPTVIKELPYFVSFYANEDLRLRCNIRGTPRPTYQWYATKSDLTDSSQSLEDQIYDPINLANDDTLTIPGKLTKAFFKFVYFCSGKNSLGTIQTNKIIVQKVTRPSSLSIKYIRHSVYKGEKFVVQCTLVPDIMPLYKFQHWEIKLPSGKTLKINQTDGRFSVIVATKFPQLHIRNVSEDDFSKTKFRCIFHSSIDNQDDVLSNYRQSVDEYPYNFMSLSTTLGCMGETIAATVGTNVELPFCSVPRTLNISWYKMDANDSKRKVEIGHKMNDTKFIMISRRYGNLLIVNATKDDSGTYLVESTDRRLKTTFTLNVYDVPVINLSPRHLQKTLSESAEFKCSGNLPKIQFRWLYNGQKISNGYDNGNVEIESTSNESGLRVKQVRLSVSGVYQCIGIFIDEIKGGSEYRQISGTLLMSEVPPSLVNQFPLAEKNSLIAHVKMSVNDTVKSMECVFAANPRPYIEWYHNSNKAPITPAIKVFIDKDQNSIYQFTAKTTINLEMSNEGVRKYAGEYQAVATNSLGVATCTTFIFVDGNLEIRVPSEQTAVGGSDYLLTCFFVASDVPEFSWDRKIDNSETWESLPVNHRTNLLEKGHRLLVKSVIKIEDQGVYRCSARLNKDSKSATTRLLVAYPPVLQNLPTKHDSTQSQTHICTIKSTADKPWYAWWSFTKYNSNVTIIISPFTKDSMYSVYYNQEFKYREPLLPGVPDFLYNFPNVGVDLNVKARSDEKDSFGKFVCHARNHIGYDEKTISDNFLRLEFNKTPPSSSEVVIGDDLYLDCTAKESDLKPVVKWRLLNGDFKYIDVVTYESGRNDRLYQYYNGTLVMKNIQLRDPSKLFCFIFPIGNSEKVLSKISYIEIRVPAWIKTMEKDISRLAGSKFNLSCDVYGHNQNLSMTWYFRSSDMGLWSKIYEACIYSIENQCVSQYETNSRTFSPIIQIHNRTYHTVHLEFHDVTDTMSGHYKCEARNKFNRDADQSSTTLTIISKPTPVIADSIQKESTSSSVTVAWKPPENNGNRPILQYLIRYYEATSTNNLIPSKNVTHKSLRVNSTVHSVVIDQLRPYRRYGIDIVAENEVGVSEVATVFLTTQEAPPQKPVHNLIASSTKPHEILISWSDPDLEFQNGFINRYQMCYQIIPVTEDLKTGLLLDRLLWPDNSMNFNQYPNVKCQFIETRTVTVSFLPQFTDFAVRVIAFNVKGPSPPSFTKVRTLEDLPQAPPSHVTCESQHQAIALTWNPPGRQTINGILKGYVVYYYQPNKYNDESEMKSISVQGRTSVVIDHLKPYTTYSIQIMVENRKGLGPPSSSVFCSTKEAKPEAPELVKAVRINGSCIFVSWLHSPNPNGKIREYCVVVFDYNAKSRKCQRPEMNKRYNTMILCDNYERYSSVQVYAKNQYESVAKDASRVEDGNYIVSIGGNINVDEGSSIILPCEVAISTMKNIYWKRDNQEFANNDFPNLRILKNSSLEVMSVTKSDRYTYSCSTDSDTIDYRLFVQDSSDGIPRTPIIDDSRVTENSVFIRWKSRGTVDVAAPITKFIINWENLYSGDSRTVTVDGNTRSFYLNNVTCASDFLVRVSAQSGNGRSEFSEARGLRTLGSAPVIANSMILLPNKNISAHSAYFNLLAFEPGENCAAMFYSIKIIVPLISGSEFTDLDLVFSRNISVFELENKCCFNVTVLRPVTTYKYFIIAYNPAGSTQTYNVFKTPPILFRTPLLSGINRTFGNQFWLLLGILVIILIAVLIVVVVKALQIFRARERRAHKCSSKMLNRKSDFNHNRIEKVNNADDNVSIGSEPSPYAVYQPDTDPKMGQPRPQLLSQQNSTPLYNYSDHHYNHIRYDKIRGQGIPLEIRHDRHRRANSAECLSSVGNTSVAGIADLESPDNIDPNEDFKAPYISCNENDEIFHNIQYPDFSTINKKKKRRESENLGNRTEEESSRLVKNNSNQGVMNTSRHSSGSRSRQNEPAQKQQQTKSQQPKQQQQQPQQQQQHQQQHQQQQHSMYPISGNRHIYRQQMSVPEPASSYNHQQYGYRSNRLRTSSGSGQSHPASQTVLPHSSGSSGQVSGYGSYYGSRAGNMQPYSTSMNARRDVDSQNNHIFPHVSTNGASNYNAVQRTIQSKPTLDPIESPDEGIYTDRVIVV